MADDAPDFPPGPRGPEDAEPGVRLSMTRDQLRFAGLYVAGIEGASAAQIEDRGAGYFEVTIFDKLVRRSKEADLSHRQ